MISRWAVLSALLYAAGVLWALRAALPAPSSILLQTPDDSSYWTALRQQDQFFSVGRISYAAHAMTHAPGQLMDGLHCWPMPNAATVGEHMLGEGVLGIVPDLLFHEPILTFNTVLVLMALIAGLTMRALVLEFTGSQEAALIGGLLFALHPMRIANTAEPYWMGNQWTPLALLFCYKLFVYRRWRDAAGLAASVSLQLLDSFYPVLAFVLIGAPFLCWICILERRSIPATMLKLLVVAAAVLVVVLIVFVPYVHTRMLWPTLLTGREKALYSAGEIAPGGRLYAGTIASVLAAIGIIDRFVGRRYAISRDPRIALLVGGLLCVWAAVQELPIIHVRSLLELATGIVPGIDAVRVGIAVGSGFLLACAAFAGFGVRALIDRRPGLLRYIVMVLLGSTAVIEIFHPTLASATFGREVTFRVRLARPSNSLLDLYSKLGPGPVLDVPAMGFLGAEYVLLSAYHGRPTVGCYGSFQPPFERDLTALASRLRTDRNAAAALYALGIRTVVSHGAIVRPGPARPGTEIRPIGVAGDMYVAALASTDQVEVGFRPLVEGARQSNVSIAAAGATAISVPFRNGSEHTYRHPDPIVPSSARAQWIDESGTVVATYDTQILLPLVLTGGEVGFGEAAIPAPLVGGRYNLVVTIGSETVSTAWFTVMAR